MGNNRTVTAFSYAPARSGKSFLYVKRIVDEWLPQTKMAIWTNLPLRPELIGDYCAETHGMNREEVISRIHLIPAEVEKSWKFNERIYIDDLGDAGKNLKEHKNADSIAGALVAAMRPGARGEARPWVYDGPWVYFIDKQIGSSVIIIDEIHNFCGISTPAAARAAWQRWLGELGHNQAIFRCISQDEQKVAKEIRDEAGAKFEIRNTGMDKDPYFKIEIYDWLELGQAFLNLPYKVFVFEQEILKVEGKKTEKGARETYLMGEPYFSFYDSFNKPIEGAQAANVKPFETVWQRIQRETPGRIKPRMRLLAWFIGKNAKQLMASRFSLAFAIGILIFCGIKFDLIGVAMKTVMPSRKDKTAAETPKPEAKKPTQKPAGQGGQKLPSEPQMTEEEKKIQRLQADLDEQKKKADTLESELRQREAISLITPESITLRNGMSYRVGETIEYGELKGKRVISINWQKREAKIGNDEKDSTAFNLFN